MTQPLSPDPPFLSEAEYAALLDEFCRAMTMWDEADERVWGKVDEEAEPLWDAFTASEDRHDA